jgi:hypothetical protein
MLIAFVKKWESLANREKESYEKAMQEWKRSEKSRPADSPPARYVDAVTSY